MRAGKLTTLSAIAALLGGTSLAMNSAIGHTSLQSGSSMQGSSEPKKSLSSRTGPQKTTFATHKRQGIGASQRGGVYAGASARELGEAGLSTQERTHLRDMVRNIPRVSSVGTDIRIDAVVPRSVRQAAAPFPPEVQQMHPRLRNKRAFKYHDQVVVVNPITSRIVAIFKTPA
jgi:hypothetical protein